MRMHSLIKPIRGEYICNTKKSRVNLSCDHEFGKISGNLESDQVPFTFKKEK